MTTYYISEDGNWGDASALIFVTDKALREVGIDNLLDAYDEHEDALQGAVIDANADFVTTADFLPRFKHGTTVGNDLYVKEVQG